MDLDRPKTIGESSLHPGRKEPPTDRYFLVFIIFVLHGIALLLPWEIMITANDYFTQHKLTPKGGVLSDLAGDDTIDYRHYFLSTVSVIAQLPNFSFNLINLFIGNDQCFGSYTTRIAISILAEMVSIAAALILALLDTTAYIGTFFYLTMISVLVLNVFNGVYTSTIYGLAGKLPHGYANAVVIGANTCGTLISSWNIVSLGSQSGADRYAAFYFLSAFVILAVALVTFLALRYNSFYQYYVFDDERNDCKLNQLPVEQSAITNDFEMIGTRKSSLLIDTKCTTRWQQYKAPLIAMWREYLNVFMIFFVTLTIFPVWQANITPIDRELFGDTAKTEKYFSATTCFLLFNLSALAGNCFALRFRITATRPLCAAVMARFAFVPFFAACNLFEATRRWPVLVQSDSIYIFGSSAFAFTSGWLSSCAVIAAKRQITVNENGIGSGGATVVVVDPIIQGKYVACFLYAGILAGAATSGQLIRFFL